MTYCGLRNFNTYICICICRVHIHIYACVRITCIFIYVGGACLNSRHPGPAASEVGLGATTVVSLPSDPGKQGNPGVIFVQWGRLLRREGFRGSAHGGRVCQEATDSQSIIGNLLAIYNLQSCLLHLTCITHCQETHTRVTR